MTIKVIRKTYTDKSTISDVYIDDKFICYILEDKDRGLLQQMSTEEIKKKKQYAVTAIPLGKYEVIVTYSNRFKKDLPLLLNVPGYEGVRIHPGNTDANTEGCLLPGSSKSTDFVGESKKAFEVLFNHIKQAIAKKEKVWVEILNSTH